MCARVWSHRHFAQKTHFVESPNARRPCGRGLRGGSDALVVGRNVKSGPFEPRNPTCSNSSRRFGMAIDRLSWRAKWATRPRSFLSRGGRFWHKAEGSSRSLTTVNSRAELPKGAMAAPFARPGPGLGHALARGEGSRAPEPPAASAPIRVTIVAASVHAPATVADTDRSRPSWQRVPSQARGAMPDDRLHT